ncbi:hypothetical protein LJC17_05290 [Acholeplasma sp. OttesenSCG-928-E16]|nr:hypothetical protein [Acholeplasma sp. OttesenSCG-928-E16]
MNQKQTKILLIIVLVLLFGGGFLIGFFIDKHSDPNQEQDLDFIEMMKDIDNVDKNDIFDEIEKLNEVLNDDILITHKTDKIGFIFS